MRSSRVPMKVGGLHIERAGEELLVYNPTTDSCHAVSAVAAAVFEACNGKRPAEEIADTVGEWVEEPVDSVVIDLTISELVNDGLITLDEVVIDLRD